MCNMCANGVMAGHFSSATLTAFKQVVASGKDVYMLIALPTAMVGQQHAASAWPLA